MRGARNKQTLLQGLALAGLAFLAMPAAAQTAAAAGPDAGPDSNAFQGDYLIVGMGVGSIPSYEGSDERAVVPGVAVTGRIAGVNIGARAAGLSLDFVPERPGSRVGFALGPVARYQSNRSRHIKDPVVLQLGKLASTVEGGIATGVSFRKVLTSQDSLSLGADVRWDVSGHDAGRIIAAGVSYFTPVSRAVVVGASVSADFMDDRYADYTFAVSPQGSKASGLPVYDAHGGLKSWGLRGFAAYDLDRNLLNGGFAVAAGLAYSRLVGSAAETPITALRGSPHQLIFGAGLAYTF